MEKPLAAQNTQKTILVTDDDPAVLKFVSGILVQNNYNVLTARNGKEAIQQSRDCNGEIHLLLSDFEMPGMGGIELATAISLERPEMQVLMMSGYVGGMLVLNEGWHFLAKPFIPSQLCTLISGLVSPTKGFVAKTSTTP
jgi:DNA-binding NtrC family response regulator